MFANVFGRKQKGLQPATVAEVDVARYCGTWYEIASFVPKEQRNCERTKAEYGLQPDGTVSVRNSCFRRGRERSVRAVASPVPGTGNAKLKVRFFRLFTGDLWIVDLDEHYSWAVASTPTGRGLWILSRTPYMDGELFASILRRLGERGFDVGRLQKTPQG